jgi:hypothetical protein
VDICKSLIDKVEMVKRFFSTQTHKHDPHAESNLEQRFLRSCEKSDLQSNHQGPKLY